jgi:hypothetical protein
LNLPVVGTLRREIGSAAIVRGKALGAQRDVFASAVVTLIQRAVILIVARLIKSALSGGDQ